MLVEQQKLRRGEHRHDERHRLTLAARQGLDAIAEAILEIEAEKRKPLAPSRAARRRKAEAKSAPARPQLGEQEVFLDAHARRRAGHRVLEDARDMAGALVQRLAPDVLAIEHDLARPDEELPGDGVEQRRFAGAIRADHDAEAARRKRKLDTVERDARIGRAGEEHLAQAVHREHGTQSHHAEAAAPGCDV